MNKNYITRLNKVELQITQYFIINKLSEELIFLLI